MTGLPWPNQTSQDVNFRVVNAVALGLKNAGILSDVEQLHQDPKGLQGQKRVFNRSYRPKMALEGVKIRGTVKLPPSENQLVFLSNRSENKYYQPN